MPDKLYVIGNGFDLHIGLKTSYSNFRDDYVRKYHPSIWNHLYEIYGNKLLGDIWWNNFEEGLGKVDYRMLTKSANVKVLSSPKIKDFLNVQLPFFFGDWLSKINGKAIQDTTLDIESSSFFFTFNYTMTLEDTYSVPSESVWHIHNSIADFREGNNKLIVGHDSSAAQLMSYYIKERSKYPEIAPLFADSINQGLANAAKQVRYRIAQNNEKFNLYNGIKHFVIMGFSLNDIDLPYIKKIVSVNKSIETADWTLYWHSKRDIVCMKKQLFNLGIKGNKMIFNSW